MGESWAIVMMMMVEKYSLLKCKKYYKKSHWITLNSPKRRRKGNGSGKG
jgi:hypothetical protein